MSTPCSAIPTRVPSSMGDPMSQSKDKPTVPKSMRHKQILDIAKENPEASMEAIASKVPSATVDLVKQVLEEYGDPGNDQAESTVETEDSAASQKTDYPDPADLTEKQLTTLHEITEHPEASQKELAEILDVSASTICNRVNGIDGFDWKERQAFVESLFEGVKIEETDDDTHLMTEKTEPGMNSSKETGESTSEANSGAKDSAMATNGTEPATTNDLEERVTVLEQQSDNRTTDEFRSVFDDPDLAHKVIRLCITADDLTEEEEHRILESILK